MPAAEKLKLGKMLLTTFFGDWLDRDPIGILRQRPPRHAFAVYGNRDSRIGLERMSELLALNGRRYPSLVLKDNDQKDLGQSSRVRCFHGAGAQVGCSGLPTPPPR